MGRKSIASKAALAVKPGKTLSEPVGGRGSGTMLLVGRDKQVSAYYRYTSPDGSRPWIELGTLSPRFTLEKARNLCSNYWQLRKDHPYLREYLESKGLEEKKRIEHERWLEADEMKTATLEDLIDDYVSHLEDQGRTSAKTIRQALDSKVISAHPYVASRKAKEIIPEDIRDILAPISQKGNLVFRNRIRSYLHAAFKFGLDREYDETRISGKVFGLTINPVAAIPVLAGAESVGERSLSEIELQTLYLNLHDVQGIGHLMSSFIRFMIASGGQRPTQVLRVPWSDYDLDQGYFKIMDSKGRGAKARAHLVPLTPRAEAILKQVKSCTGGYEWPFSLNGKAPISIQSLKNVARRFLDSEYGKAIDPFTIRDLRRTCKQVMTRAKIPRDQRNLLQNHGQSGVDAKHYDNDPFAHLPMKKQTMQRYDRALRNVLEGKKRDKVVSLKQ